jgi:membrane protein implicated in regulation of membrane protease activity
MFIYAYVFALVLGSILLGASFLLGGDHDADGDVEAHADAGHDLDTHTDAGHDAHGDLGGFFGVLGSMRFWTFFAAFFGLTGVVLDGFDLTAELMALGLSIGVGFVTGWLAVTLLRRLAANDTGVAAGVGDYVGKTGELLIAVRPDRIGKIRIELKGTTVDVLALTDDEPIAKGEQALILEMREDKAIVVRLDSARASAQA